MNYKELKDKLLTLNEDQLLMTVTVHDPNVQEFYPATFLIESDSDVLGPEHPVIFIDNPLVINEIRRPMTSDQAIDRYPNYTEESTCSMNCPKCKKRIWFKGSWPDKEIPITFQCPYCNEVINENPKAEICRREREREI